MGSFVEGSDLRVSVSGWGGRGRQGRPLPLGVEPALSGDGNGAHFGAGAWCLR